VTDDGRRQHPFARGDESHSGLIAVRGAQAPRQAPAPDLQGADQEDRSNSQLGDLEDRRKELRRLIPASPKSRLQFSEEIADDGAKVFASAEQLGLEGIVSKRLGSKYKSGRVNTWRKTKCWTESTLVLIGTEIDKRSGSPIALLAKAEEDGLRYVGGAFFTLKAAHRDALRDRIARLGTDRSRIPALRKRQARWIKPDVVVGVRHLRGSGTLRHATVRSLME